LEKLKLSGSGTAATGGMTGAGAITLALEMP
jgi:hypothetical protein